MDWKLSDIVELLRKASELGVHRHIEQIPEMFIHPHRFWNAYDSLSKVDKCVQFVVYGLLSSVFIWLTSYRSPSSYELLKILTMEVATIFPYVIIDYLAYVAIKCSWKGICRFFVLCCYMKFVCLIPQLIVLKAYYETETPLLMAIAVIIPLIVELMIIIYPAYIWQIGSRDPIKAVLLTILFLNIYDCLFIFTGWPRPYNPNYEDKITQERFELGKSIKNAYDIPMYVLTYERSKDFYYLYSSPLDTVASRKFLNVDQFIGNIKEDMDSLKEIVKRCHFQTNKIFFNKVYMLKKDILYVHETKMYNSSPVVKQTSFMRDSVVFERVYVREFNEEISMRNESLMEYEYKARKQYETAFSYSYIAALWHPCLFLSTAYHKEK